MARYFFDIRDGEQVVDETGHPCANFDAAKHEAIFRLSQKLLDLHAAWDGSIWTMTIRNEQGKTAASIVLSAEANS